jgi:hypothetical protein
VEAGSLFSLRVAQTVGRSLAPLFGVVFLGWSAANLVVLYFADTLIGMTMVMAAVFAHTFGPKEDESPIYVLSDWISFLATGAFVASFVAIPFAGPVLFLLLRSGFDPVQALDDPELRAGLLFQIAAALIGYLQLLPRLAQMPLEALGARRRFGMLFIRWFLLCVVALSPIGVLLGTAGGIVLVALYAGLTIFGELAPDHFMGLFERPGATHTPVTSSTAPPQKRKKPRRPH